MNWQHFFDTKEMELDVEQHEKVRESSSVSIFRFNNELSTAGFSILEDCSPDNPSPVSGKTNVEAVNFQNRSLFLNDDGRYEFEQISDEVIARSDERKRVMKPSLWPWRAHGHLEVIFPNKKKYLGSGTMVGEHHVLTAGQCIYSKKDGGWAASVTFQPSRNDKSLPFGEAYATRLLSIKGWTDHEDPRYDMGMLILDRNIGRQIGWYGIITGPDRTFSKYRVNVSDYPGDKGGLQMWTMSDIITSVQQEKFFYSIEASEAQIGSSVWSLWQGHKGEKVCGIHTTGSLSGKGTTRISRPKFDRIVDWFSSY